MGVNRVELLYNQDKGERGFEIQNLQKSKIFRGKSIEDIVIQSINSGKDRGGHYHERKMEWFMALDGKATLFWTENLKPAKSDLNTELLESDFKDPYVLEIPPMVVHWVKNYTKEVFIMTSFSTEEYSSQKPDSYKVEMCFHNK